MCSDIIFLAIFTKGTVWTMVKMIALKCPECGSKLQIEDGHKECFCQYCGHKILLDDGNKKVNVNVINTYHKIDDARIKEAEVDKLVRLKELEVEEKKLNKKMKSRRFRAILGLSLLIIGGGAIILSRIFNDDGFFEYGFFAIIGALLVGFVAIIGDL